MNSGYDDINPGQGRQIYSIGGESYDIDPLRRKFFVDIIVFGFLGCSVLSCMIRDVIEQHERTGRVSTETESMVPAAFNLISSASRGLPRCPAPHTANDL
jgi:hypothetical protein